MKRFIFSSSLVVSLVLTSIARSAEQPKFISHPPVRPLPQASSRPLEKGAVLFVDPAQGDDANTGTREKPLRTIQTGASRLQAGETLVLRGGTYFEHVAASLAGTTQKPITIRAFPGELAILDGGISEFQLAPKSAWEECPGGVAGEFRSKKTYPNLASGDGPGVLGNFGDSLIPLQGYRFRTDLQSNNPYWNVTNKVGEEGAVYCGPGIWYDATTGHIHARLAPTTLSGLHNDNYRGITDPREAPLIIAGESSGPALSLAGCRNVRLQDLVIRGARTATLQIQDCRNIELDGLTVYGGSSAIQVKDTVGLRMQHTACRGIGAPWTFRGCLKYRSLEARILSASSWDPTGAEHGQFEIAFCEFTDSVDGVFVGSVRGLRFHHNLLDNITDDGMFLTAGTGYDGFTSGGDHQICQNRFSRILTTFAFGVGHGRQRVTPEGKQTGSGAHIFRNVFDFRRPVWYHWPTGPEDNQEITSRGRFGGDHGGPAWEPMWIYHNTILGGDTPRYDYGSDGLIHGVARGIKRRVFNNIVCLTLGTPGSTLPPIEADFQADGNLLWSLAPEKPLTDAASHFAKFRASAVFEASKAKYAPGWTTHDIVADPKLNRLVANWNEQLDLRPATGSPAIDAGVAVPRDWPDTLRESDDGQPDIGALPLDSEPWRIGVRGRIDVFARPVNGELPPNVANWSYRPQTDGAVVPRPRAAIFEGYPAFDSPLIAYLLRRRGWQVEVFERTMPDSSKFADYQLLAFDGSLARAKAAKTQFDSADLAALHKFLAGGGTLLLMRERPGELFGSPEGRKFLTELVGTGTREPEPVMTIQKPEHPWVKHVTPGEHPWQVRVSPLATSRGEVIAGSEKGAAALYRLPVDHGQLIYVGWTIADAIPGGRLKTTVEQEEEFDQQVKILQGILLSSSAP